MTERTPSEAAAVYLTYGIAVAEGHHDAVPPQDFREARDEMLRDPAAQRAAAAFVLSCSTPKLLSSHLRSHAVGQGSYAIRRGIVHEAVDQIMAALAAVGSGPGDDQVLKAVERLDADSVRTAWSRAIARREADPDGAVTAARTLLESTLKTILDDRAVSYGEGEDLPKLYGRVQQTLQLSPAEQTEDRFRALLGACTTIVKEVGSVRNRHSDAHGDGRTVHRVEDRHAALAVNLAGSMALFLIATHEALPGAAE